MNDCMCTWCKTVIRTSAGDTFSTDATGATYHPECETAAVEYLSKVGYEALVTRVLEGPGAGVRGKSELKYKKPPTPKVRRIQ